MRYITELATDTTHYVIKGLHIDGNDCKMYAVLANDGTVSYYSRDYLEKHYKMYKHNLFKPWYSYLIIEGKLYFTSGIQTRRHDGQIELCAVNDQGEFKYRHSMIYDSVVDDIELKF